MSIDTARKFKSGKLKAREYIALQSSQIFYGRG